MSHEQMIQNYYRILEQHDCNALLKLFSKEALIVHPIFGNLPASAFFKILLDRALSHQITIINIFKALHEPCRMAAFINAKFITKDNSIYEEEGVHIFDFQPEALIKKMTIIIDTFPFRSKYL